MKNQYLKTLVLSMALTTGFIGQSFAQVGVTLPEGTDPENTMIIQTINMVDNTKDIFIDIEGIAERESILTMHQNGYIKGTGDSKFEPNKEFTNAQMIQLFVNSFKLNIDNIRFIKEPKATDYFANAEDNAWYANAAIIAPLNGLQLDKNISFEQGVTKEEFIYQLVTLAESKFNLPMIKMMPAKIADEENLKAEYQGAIQRALLYRITELDEEGRINPKKVLTRAEAIDITCNMLKQCRVTK